MVNAKSYMSQSHEHMQHTCKNSTANPAVPAIRARTLEDPKRWALQNYPPKKEPTTDCRKSVAWLFWMLFAGENLEASLCKLQPFSPPLLVWQRHLKLKAAKKSLFSWWSSLQTVRRPAETAIFYTSGWWFRLTNKSFKLYHMPHAK